MASKHSSVSKFASRLMLSVVCTRRKSKLKHFSSGSARSSLPRPKKQFHLLYCSYETPHDR